jgi:hypothetical protein
MKRVSRLALRLLFLVAVATAVTMLYAPASGSNSPYMSALSDVTLGTQVQAAPCRHTRCNPLYNTCFPAVAATCIVPKKGTICTGSVSCG